MDQSDRPDHPTDRDGKTAGAGKPPGASSDNRAEAFFWKITAYPKTILLISLIMILGLGAFLPTIVKDTSADAFIDPENPALIYRNKVKQVFGLDDPYVIAVLAPQAQTPGAERGQDPGGIYQPDILALVEKLTEGLRQTENIDPDRVTSLATEANIVGTYDGMEVEDFFDLAPELAEAGPVIRQAIDDFPLFQGSLVARDGRATMIVAEVLDEDDKQATYDRILALVEQQKIPEGVMVHVAGEGAINGYLGTYIDRDATRLNPIAGLVITLVLIVAFRTWAGAMLPNVVVLATVMAALGTMAAVGVPFFVVTNGLPVILIGIAVADSIHILSQYYEEQVAHPGESPRHLIVRAMGRMWRPVTLTTVTTIAGFAGLYFGAEMPPMRYFGLFAAVGVAFAWLYSLTFLPAAITLFKIKPSKLFAGPKGHDRAARALEKAGRVVLAHPRSILALLLLVTGLGLWGASRVTVDDAQIENFQKDEPIFLADQAINGSMDGTNFLDIVIETEESEGLFQPQRLRKIADLQRFAEGLPGVGGSTSIVDYIQQMHKAVMENQQSAYSVPDDPLLIAQLFLLYSTSGDPTDLEEEVDYSYQRANVRVSINNAYYSNNKQVVEALETYISQSFNEPGLSANLSGRVYLNHHWLKGIDDNHLTSMGLSLLLVWAMSALVFQSLLAGVLALIPVLASLLVIYATMGFGGIWLGVGTSMFAAIAIGLGVDFSIHTLDRMKELMMTAKGSLDDRLAGLFPSTGRALFFNFAAVALGFLTLTSSEVPPLVNFGLLVALAISSAFLAAMTVLPALAKILKPGFLLGDDASDWPTSTDGPASRKKTTGGLGIVTRSLLILAIAAGLYGGLTTAVRADENLSGPAIMEMVVARDEGAWVTRKLVMELTDRNGATRTRETFGYRRYYGEEKRTVLYYTAPANVKGTGFLTYDYPEADRDDDQWLYLPALRKVRRISAANRGDYFLGTDFTYEDMKKENKVALEDYSFTFLHTEDVNGRALLVVEGKPVSQEVAEELGYGRARWYVDPEIWIARRTEIWDVAGNPLKTIDNDSIEEIQGIWTVLDLQVLNHKTQHHTRFIFSDIDYDKEVKDRVFKTSALKRGLK
ncbi:outer membrane lipoprotein-sorting protein [Rhodovibrionaceae bacterium A322]